MLKAQRFDIQSMNLEPSYSILNFCRELKLNGDKLCIRTQNLKEAYNGFHFSNQ
jgi:hypothetical protein